MNLDFNQLKAVLNLFFSVTSGSVSSYTIPFRSFTILICWFIWSVCVAVKTVWLPMRYPCSVFIRVCSAIKTACAAVVSLRVEILPAYSVSNRLWLMFISVWSSISCCYVSNFSYSPVVLSYNANIKSVETFVI